MIFDKAPDDRGVAAEFMVMQRRKRHLRQFPWNDGDELAFIGDVQGIKTEQIAGCLDRWQNPDRAFLDFAAKARGPGNFVQGCRKAAATIA